MKDRQHLTDQYCVFQADDAIWAIAATSVREVSDSAPVVTVPEAPAEMIGVCHIRMEFVPVLSLLALLGEANPRPLDAAYLLILDDGEGPWALPIQRALSLHTLEIAIGGSVNGSTGPSTGVLGTASFRDEVLQIVDSAWLYRRATSALESHWSNMLTANSHAASPHVPALTS